MRGNEFLDKMELIEPAYVEAADSKKSKKKFSFIGFGAVAACLSVAVLSLMILLPEIPLPDESQNQDTDLPMLTISIYSGEMGFEGHLANDVSELINANPWSEDSEISTLPVYQNALTYNEQYIAFGVDLDKMRECILEVAGRLGLDTNNLTVTDNAPDEETKEQIIKKFQMSGSDVPEGYFDPKYLKISTDEVEIEVDQDLTATIRFKNAIALPEEYNFTQYASYEDMVAVADYLKSEYSNIISYDNPQVNICDGSYNIYKLQKYSIEFFDSSDNFADEIINYNFNRVEFYCNDDGELYLIRIYRSNFSDKLGDYPIISAEEAKELLLDGNYYSTVPYPISDEELVKKVELVYRANRYEECYMPYYRFYVELPEMEIDGLKNYGAYYVPAVESSYIVNMPTCSEYFN